MREKDLGVSDFLDVYGNLLDEKQRQIIDMYYNDDYSLSEISEICKISRQGVGESIKKSVARLKDVESKLHLLERRNSFRKHRSELLVLIDRLCDAEGAARTELRNLIVSEIDELVI